MSTIERYAVAWAELDGVECHAGVELRDNDDVNELTHNIRAACRASLYICGGNYTEIEKFFEDYVTSRFRGESRAFFVECESDDRGVQVYQPYEMPIRARDPNGQPRRQDDKTRFALAPQRIPYPNESWI
jgi:hypothetical protein